MHIDALLNDNINKSSDTVLLWIVMIHRYLYNLYILMH